MSSVFDQQSHQALASEIETSLQEASSYLDAYLNCGERQLLEKTYQCITTLNGVLKLTQFRGVKDVNKELLSTLELIRTTSAPSNLQLTALCQAMLILPRYMTGFAKSMTLAEPQLLLPYVNGLRASQLKPLYPETFYADFDVIGLDFPPGSFRPGSEISALGYARQMYIWGLLGYIKQSSGFEKRSHLKVMKQALLRIYSVHNDDFWLIALGFIESVEDKKLALDIGRKRLFTAIDKQIKYLSDGRAIEPSITTKRDLLYLVHIAGSLAEHAHLVRDKFQLGFPHKDDIYYQEMHADLYSPDSSTVAVLVDEIRTDIDAIKVVLLTLQPGMLTDAVAVTIKNASTRASALLNACGMSDLSEPFQQMLKDFDDAAVQKITQEHILVYSQQIVQVEESLSQLTSLPGKTRIEQRLIDIDSDSQSEPETSPSLHVLHECEADLEEIMSMVDNFVKSKYKLKHIENVRPILHKIKTCLQFIQEDSGAELAEDLIRFFNIFSEQAFTQAKIDLWLNNLADATVLVQEYLIALRKQEQTGNILKLAKIATNRLLQPEK